MSVLVVGESRMYIGEDGKYYKVSINNEHYARYYQFSEKINLLMRTEKIDNDSKKGMNIIDLKNLNVISCPSIMSFKMLLKNYFKVHRIIEENVKNNEFIVVKGPGLFCNIATKYARKYKKPYFAELGGCPFDGYWNHGISGKLMAPYMFFSTRKLMRNASHALYVTKYFLEKRYPTNGKYINCSNVTLESQKESVLDKRLEKINETNLKKITLCTIADIDVKFKGQQYIIKAIPEIKKRLGIDITYVLIGRGKKDYLEKVAKDNNVEKNVVFLGSKKHNEVFEELGKIDIYVQPSRQEGLPRAVIEAMSCGVPAFGANTAGIPELIDKEYIFSNTNRNIEEIVKIISLMNDKEILKKLAIENYKKAKDYDFDVLKARRENIYNDFIIEVRNEKKD